LQRILAPLGRDGLDREVDPPSVAAHTDDFGDDALTDAQMVPDTANPAGGDLADEDESFALAVTIEVQVSAVLSNALDSTNQKFAFRWPRFF
jgi:hypothetical protein